MDAGRATSSSAPALLHINEVTVDGNPVTVGDSLRLSGPHRRIIFNFAAITLSIPERVQYKYKLENFDEDWSKAVAVPEVTYNNLNSGHYQFRLMARTVKAFGTVPNLICRSRSRRGTGKPGGFEWGREFSASWRYSWFIVCGSGQLLRR